MESVTKCQLIYIVATLLLLLLQSVQNVNASHATSHPSHRWFRTEVMDSNGLYILDWKIQSKEIHFQVTVNTRGFIGLGFSHHSGKMTNADLVLAWVDDRTGKPNVLVGFIFKNIFLQINNFYPIWSVYLINNKLKYTYTRKYYIEIFIFKEGT